MTQAARITRWTLLMLAVGGVVPVVALGQPLAEPEPPPGWVARVMTKTGNRYLTLDRLADAVLWRQRAKFKDPGSGPLTVLKQLLQEMMIEQEAQRLGVSVTDAELKKEFDRLDREVRGRTNGNRNLQNVIRRDLKTTVTEFRANLRHLMLKERVASHQQWIGKLPRNESARLAQIEVVVAELLKKTDLKYGFPTALQDPPAKLAPGVVAEVNREPLTARKLGKELVKRLPVATVKSVIQEECRAVLTADWALTPEEMDKVIERERSEWDTVRLLATQEAYHTLPYEDFVRLQYGLDVENMRHDRYYRGLFGLVQSNRDSVTDDEIRADWEENRTTIWGDRYLVWDIQIHFQPHQQALLGPNAGRDYKTALKMANSVLRRIHSGAETFDQVVSTINQKQDRTFFAKRISVRNTANEQFLYDQAKLLQDETVSRPFETLTEVHVVRREKHSRAPTFQEVADTILQRIAFRRAHEYLEERMTNPEIVEVRWPPEDL